MTLADQVERQMTSCALCSRGVHQVLGMMPTSQGLVCNVCVEGLVAAGMVWIARQQKQREMDGRIAA